MINIVYINGPICTNYSGILSKRILADLGVFKVTELRMWFKHAQKGQKPTTARPERAEALSPGHRPGYNSNQQCAL